mgnify:CR=1 FL=1
MIETGRVTVPTDVDVIDATIEIINRWKADAIRDCDGTDMPEELRKMDIKQYATYYTTRKDNAWAKANPDEIQQMYLMSDFVTAKSTELKIQIMQHFYKDQLKPNTKDNHRWWEVIDRTTDDVITNWDYDEETGEVIIHDTIPYHAYTVSFLAFVIWDPVHMYNALTNDWKGEEHQMTFDVRQPKTQKYVLDKFRKFCEERDDVDVVRFTTFFHQFTLQFDEFAREKFVDWFGYSASVSPYILEQFEKEVGYPFRAEYIINKGFNNSTFCVPTKEYRDFMDFQQREVSKLAKKFVDICHEYGKEAMMFLKQKMDAAQGFIDAVKQRQNTLMTTMQAIIDLQRPFFLEGDESLLKPMILKDVAERTGLDISTISRVSNSKYVQTNFGIYPLKFFFSDGYTTEDGEEMSVREIRKILKECIDGEDKKKPLTDDELADILKEKGYPIARRTVAKYRQQLNIPVARLRK